MKVEESLNVTFDKSPPPTKLSPLVNDDVGEEEAIKKNTKVVNNNNEKDESKEIHQGDVKEVQIERFETNQDADVNGDQAHQGDEAVTAEWIALYNKPLKIESVKNRIDCPLPYGLLITRLYRFVLAKHPKLVRPHHTLQFVLHYRMMSSVNRKNGRKRNKSEEVKLDIPYSPSSVESSNQSSPLLGYWSSMD
ncbi:hypothetical protein Tco_0728033 [Tanacetum coccineum]|uniref:Uncharacterized protein n=1 Tax=Tanacetum coccineum TaxID=301880 RepID=A0ABQ4YKV1_9ASTR